MFWKATEKGFRLSVKLTPKSSRDALGIAETLADGAVVLRAYVRAVPEDGKANIALINVLAKALDLPKSAIELESGSTSRMKTFSLRDTRGDLGEKLARLG